MIKLDNIDLKIIDISGKKTVSGEELSKEFCVSRTAIWKRIKKLENIGYKFSHSKEGYKLLKRTQLLLENEIKPLLKTNTIGQNYIFFKEIDSTNTYSKSTDLPHGTVVVAENQTKGKGRKGRKWLSTSQKGLYFSITLKPNIQINELMKFSLIFPLALQKTLKEYGFNTKIKWPNDIYLNNKKLAGILLETDIEGSEIKKIVVGIGININHSENDLQEVKDIATSLKIESGKSINRKKLFADLLYNIEKLYLDYTSKNLDVLKEVEKNLLWKNEKVILIDGDNRYEGVLAGLNLQGGLQILLNGKIIDFYSGDLSLRRI